MLYEEGQVLHLDVRRKCLISDAMKEAKKRKFNPRKHIEVVHVKVHCIQCHFM